MTSPDSPAGVEVSAEAEALASWLEHAVSKDSHEIEITQDEARLSASALRLLAQQPPAPALGEARKSPRDAFQALRDALPEGAAEARLERYLEDQKDPAPTLADESDKTLAEAALHAPQDNGLNYPLMMLGEMLSNAARTLRAVEWWREQVAERRAALAPAQPGSAVSPGKEGQG